MRTRGRLNCRPINIYSVVMDIVNGGSVVNICNIIHPDILVGCLPDFLRARTGNISLIIINIGIVYYSGIMYNVNGV